MSDFISDEDMLKLEGQETDSSGFISDEEMAELDSQTETKDTQDFISDEDMIRIESSQNSKDTEEYSSVDSFVAGAADSFTMGLMPAAAGRLDAAYEILTTDKTFEDDWDNVRDDNVQKYIDKYEKARSDNPTSYDAGGMTEMALGVVSPTGMVKGLAKGAKGVNALAKGGSAAFLKKATKESLEKEGAKLLAKEGKDSLGRSLLKKTKDSKLGKLASKVKDSSSIKAASKRLGELGEGRRLVSGTVGEGVGKVVETAGGFAENIIGGLTKGVLGVPITTKGLRQRVGEEVAQLGIKKADEVAGVIARHQDEINRQLGVAYYQWDDMVRKGTVDFDDIGKMEEFVRSKVGETVEEIMLAGTRRKRDIEEAKDVIDGVLTYFGSKGYGEYWKLKSKVYAELAQKSTGQSISRMLEERDEKPRAKNALEDYRRKK